MKHYSLFAFLSVIPALHIVAQQSAKPNIIFIMSDDHAESAISAYGSELSRRAPTPNIDRLAKEGAIFHSNYCCNSLSGPSRAAILTGKHSHKNGFLKNWKYGFDASQQTLPKILQSQGYQTAVIGKWHLISLPTGFDHYSILNDQGDYYNPSFISGGDTVRNSGYVTEIITNKTLEWLQNRENNKPFFLMMHHKAPHRNWVPAPENYHLFDSVQFPVPANYFDDYKGRVAASRQEMNIYRDMYEGHDLKMTSLNNPDSLLYDPWPHAFLNTFTKAEKETYLREYRDKNKRFFEKERTPKEIALWKYQRFMQEYLACIRSVDESVGEILDYLARTGLDKNTIVVYTSDQGFYLGEHGWFDKRFMYEESMCMPLLMKYPPVIPAGTEINELTQNIDFAPTFLDLACLDIPGDMQGKSFKPLLEKKKIPWRDYLYYHYYEHPGFHNVMAHYGIKGKRYKLMNFYEENNWELYDLVNDPMEMNNIFGMPGTEEISDKLKCSLDSLQRAYDVPVEFMKD